MEKVQPPKQFGSSDIETSDEATIWGGGLIPLLFSPATPFGF
jgi:hypothetical protein